MNLLKIDIKILLYIFIFVTISQNFISKIFYNLTGISGGAFGSYLYISFYLFFFLKLLFVKELTLTRSLKIILTLILLINILIIIKLSFEDFDYKQGLFGYINTTFVMFTFLIPFLFKLSKSDCLNLLKFIVNISVIFSIIAILQFFFYNNLPKILLEPPVVNDLRYDFITFTNFTFFRVNGLIGNPIEFGFFLTLIISIQMFFIRTNKKKFLDKLKMLILIIANIFTFSRTSIAGLFLIMGIYLLFNYKFKQKILIILSILIVILLLFFADSNFINYIYIRLTGTDIYASRSTLDHFQDYYYSYLTFLKSPFWGVPVGSISSGATESKLITDGYWIALILEFGSLIFLLYTIIYFYIAFLIKKYSEINEKTKILAYTFISFWVYSLIANILNSAMNSKSIYTLFWLFSSLIIFYQIQTNREKDENNLHI